MAKVVIAFDPEDPARQGSTVDVTDEEAQIMVKEGRARYANGGGSTTRRGGKKAKRSEPDEAPA